MKKSEAENSSNLTYTQAVKLLQKHCSSLKEERLLSSWAEKNDITYRTLVNILNEKSPYDMPKFVQESLKVFGYHVELEIVTIFKVKKFKKGDTNDNTK